MMEDKTPITTTKITVWLGADFTVIRSASLRATPVRTSYFLVSTLVSQNPTFVALFTITLSKFTVHGPQLLTFLTGQGCTIETVTIIRERSTGTCRPLASFLDNTIDDSPFPLPPLLSFPSSSQANLRASVLPNSLLSRLHEPSWIRSSPLFKFLLQPRMARQQPPHSIRQSKQADSIAGDVSKSIILKAQTPILGVVPVAWRMQMTVHATLATPRPPFSFSVDWTLYRVRRQSNWR